MLFSAWENFQLNHNLIAISCYESSVIMLLNDSNIDLSISYKDGITPLMMASMYPVRIVVKALLKHPKATSIDEKTKEGSTALHFAVLIYKLVTSNENKYVPFIPQYEVIESSVKKKNYQRLKEKRKDIINDLLDAGIDPTVTGNPKIGKGNQKKNVKASDILLDHSDIKKTLALAEKENKETREERKKKFFEKNQKEKTEDDQYNKLIEAIYNKDVDSLKKIIENNKDNKYFLTKEDTISFYMPLHMAVIWGRTNIVEALLGYDDLNVNGQNHYGVTPLSLAIVLGYDDIFDILIKKEGVNFNKIDQNMYSPLLYSLILGNEKAFNVLISKDDINVNAKDLLGNTALNYAAVSCRVDMVNKLIKRQGIAINTQDTKGATALHNVVDYLNLLIYKRHQAETAKNTALVNNINNQIKDVKPKCKKIIDALIQAGIDPTLRMSYKDKSLKASELVTFIDIREYLLKAEDNYISKKKNKRNNKPPPKNGKAGIIFFIIIFSLVTGSSTVFYLVAELLRKKKEEERKALEKKADAESAKDEKNKSKKTKRRKRLKKMAL